MSNKDLIYNLIDNKINTIELTDIHFDENDINERNFIEFINALKLNTSLKHVSLVDITTAAFTNEHFILLFKSLQNNLLLETFNFSGKCMFSLYEKNYFYNKNIEKYFNYFKNYFQYSLKFIDDNLLNCFNKLSDDYINSIQSNIINNINNFYDDAIIFDVLRRCKKIDFSGNCLYRDNNFLPKLLQNNTNLEELNISYNSIINSKWIDCLNNNTTLKVLKINEKEEKLIKDTIDEDIDGEDGEDYDNRHIKLRQDLFFNILTSNHKLIKLELWVDFKEKDKIPDEILSKCKHLDLLIIHTDHYKDLYKKQLFKPFIDNNIIKEIRLMK